MAKTFSRWITASFKLFETDVDLKLRALDKREAPGFKKQIMDHFVGVERKEGEPEQTHEERTLARLESFNSLCRDAFLRYVRLPEAIEDEERPGELIDTGEKLCAVAPADFIYQVMLKLAGLASLGDTEGKSSGSLSTSTVAAGLPTTVSPASTTEDTVSPTPSTATAEMSDELFSRVG